MKAVRAKKHLGQHFLKDPHVAQKIANLLRLGTCQQVLEIGPGMGILTQYLLERKGELFVIEIDGESVDYLNQHFPVLKERIFFADFLTFDIPRHFSSSVAIVGNFPYNISSQILFKVWENREYVPEFAGMFQKEVAERICAAHGSKTYGILSVLVQSFYDVAYQFTVSETLFSPPPKVKSAVIYMQRKVDPPRCSALLLKQIVKLAFNQRRKTLRNSLKSLAIEKIPTIEKFQGLRPEQLSVADFVYLCQQIEYTKAAQNFN